MSKYGNIVITALFMGLMANGMALAKEESGSDEQCMEERKAPPAEGDRQDMREKMKPRMDKMLERLTEKLNLNADQKTKIEQIMKDSGEQIRREMDAMKGRAKDIRAKTDTEIEKVLTAEQKKKYQELKKEMGKKFNKKMMRRGAWRPDGRNKEGGQPR